MVACILIAVMFAAGAIANLLGTPINWAEGLTCSAISILVMGMLVWIKTSHRKADKTLQWLIQNKDTLSDEPEYFRDGPVFDKPIGKQTKLRSYRVVTSAFVITSASELGMEIRHGIWAGFFATAWTLVFGWWGFPWGPIRTIQALIHNLSGGDHQSVNSAILAEEMGWDFESGQRHY